MYLNNFLSSNNLNFEISLQVINQFQCYQTLLMDYTVGISFNNTINVIFRKIKVAVCRSISFLWWTTRLTLDVTNIMEGSEIK